MAPRMVQHPDRRFAIVALQRRWLERHTPDLPPMQFADARHIAKRSYVQGLRRGPFHALHKTCCSDRGRSVLSALWIDLKHRIASMGSQHAHHRFTTIHSARSTFIVWRWRALRFLNGTKRETPSPCSQCTSSGAAVNSVFGPCR